MSTQPRLSSITDMENEIIRLRKIEVELTEEKKLQMATTRRMLSQVEESFKELVYTKENNQKLRLDISESTVQNGRLTKELEATKANMEDLRKWGNERLAERNLLQKKLDEIGADVQAKQKIVTMEHRTTIQQKDAIIANLKKKLIASENDVLLRPNEHDAKVIADQKDQLDTKSYEILNLRREIDQLKRLSLEKIRTEVTEQCNKVVSENTNLLKEVQQHKETIKSLEYELQSRDRESEIRDNQESVNQETITKLTKDITQWKVWHSSDQKKLAQQDTTIEQLKDELEKAMKFSDDSASQKDLVELRCQNADLTKNITECSKSIADQNGNIQDLVSKIRTIENDCKHFKGKSKLLKKQLKKSRRVQTVHIQVSSSYASKNYDNHL